MTAGQLRQRRIERYMTALYDDMTLARPVRTRVLLGSFGLEVSGGQREFPGGQNCWKVNQGQLNSSDPSFDDQERSELVPVHGPVVTL